MKLSFTIYQIADREYYFKLKTAAGELLLTGNRYPSIQACRNDIICVRLNAGRAGAYERRMTLNTCFEFVIRNLEGQMVARSQAYVSSHTRDKMMEIVKSLAREAAVNDLT